MTPDCPLRSALPCATRPSRSTPFADAPVAPLAAGMLAHWRWTHPAGRREPFSDWDAPTPALFPKNVFGAA